MVEDRAEEGDEVEERMVDDRAEEGHEVEEAEVPEVGRAGPGLGFNDGSDEYLLGLARTWKREGGQQRIMWVDVYRHFCRRFTDMAISKDQLQNRYKGLRRYGRV